jgi:alpha-galactosidase
LNRGSHPQKLNLKWGALDIANSEAGVTTTFKQSSFAIRDLWLKKAAGTTKGTLKQEVGAHDVIMLKLTKQ